MRIKICGLTDVQNAAKVAKLGIDAIGLVFYQKSKRSIDAKTAKQIINVLPPFINRVGLFVNAKSDFIEKILCEVPLDTLQFHGDETADECAQYDMPFIKAIRMNTDVSLDFLANEYRDASGLLLDSDSNEYGGAGKVFDWGLVSRVDMPIILAGGLNIDNVASAIKQVNPYAVDVSSGVESAKGFKDIEKVKQFIRQVDKCR